MQKLCIYIYKAIKMQVLFGWYNLKLRQKNAKKKQNGPGDDKPKLRNPLPDSNPLYVYIYVYASTLCTGIKNCNEQVYSCPRGCQSWTPPWGGPIEDAPLKPLEYHSIMGFKGGFYVSFFMPRYASSSNSQCNFIQSNIFPPPTAWIKPPPPPSSNLPNPPPLRPAHRTNKAQLRNEHFSFSKAAHGLREWC